MKVSSSSLTSPNCSRRTPSSSPPSEATNGFAGSSGPRAPFCKSSEPGNIRASSEGFMPSITPP